MGRTNESSLMFALAELQGLEKERIDARAREDAERRAKEAEQAERERAERIAAAQRTEAEAKARVEVQARAQEAESVDRIARLKRELEAVQAERERLHQQLVVGAGDTATRRTIGARGWAAAFATASAAAIVLAIILVTGGASESVPTAQPEPQITAPMPEHATPPTSTTATSEPIAAATTEPAATTVPRRHSRPVRHIRRNTETSTLGIENCSEDDPTCGIEED